MHLNQQRRFFHILFLRITTDIKEKLVLFNKRYRLSVKRMICSEIKSKLLHTPKIPIILTCLVGKINITFEKFYLLRIFRGISSSIFQISKSQRYGPNKPRLFTAARFVYQVNCNKSMRHFFI